MAFQEAADALAQSALVHGGWHEEAVETMVVEACVIARSDGTDAALGYIGDELNSGLRMWRVGERISAHVYNRVNEVPHVVGRCYLSKEIRFWAGRADRSPGRDALGESLDAYRPAVLVTDVQAHDEASARWRASESFAEARAILLLASGSPPYGVLRPHFVLDDADGLRIQGDGDPIMVVHRVLADGSLWPGYQELSQAAAKDDEDRTDWERRTLGAARWYQRAVLDNWPAASLVAAMSAIEAVLCFPGERVNKDRHIADRLIRYDAKVRGVRDQDRRQWFTSLYGRWRNNAIHDARFYLEERDIERLVEVSEAVVHWAVQHLDSEHHPHRRPCTTIQEAHGQHD
jgi:hypothetical protein